MTYREMQKLLRDNQALVDDLCDTMTKHSPAPELAEQILLWLAGLSAGMRQAPIANDAWVHPAAIAWQFAASMEMGS